MAIEQIAELTMPRLGETMEEGTVVAWLVGPGDSYRRGQTIAEVETDKTVVELPALADGRVVEIKAKAGEEVPVGGVLAKVTTVASKQGPAAAVSRAAKPKSGQTGSRVHGGNAAGSGNGGDGGDGGAGLLASPNARRVAEKMGVGLHAAVPTGRRGRITAEDVARAAARGGMMLHEAGSETGIALNEWPRRITADKKPILLVHGLFGNAASWNGVAASLSQMGAGVLAADLPGHGRSRSHLTDVHDIAAAVLREFRARVQGPFRVAGISLGAAVASRIAVLDSEVAELLLVCPAGLGEKVNASFVAGMLEAAEKKDAGLLGDQLQEHGVSLGQKALSKLAAELNGHHLQLRTYADTHFPAGRQELSIVADLERAVAPTKALFAKGDGVFAPGDATNLPFGAAAHFLPGAGHLPHLASQGKVAAFLSET